MIQDFFSRLLAGAPKRAPFQHHAGSLGHASTLGHGPSNAGGLLKVGLQGGRSHPGGMNQAKVFDGPAQLGKRQAFPWRDQMYRLGAALHDMSGGRGNLAAADERFEERRRQAGLDAWAAQVGMDAMQRALLQANPHLWLQIYGRAGQGEPDAHDLGA